MKSLKITLVAIFSIVLLTGVNSLNDTESSNDNTNKEVKKSEVKLIVMTDLKKEKKPTNG
ncbi:hypothetical protein [Olleya aquimaris]|uniref:Uncharacterized protein n=1 Tax=Olleya aquimaris TaxID=639310 RepID=A0A327RX29_9FLAO|nr:hypothetical protein [Olleya aquimaris]RAJ18147.1 hypothetical protein LY08_00421 [Olleya aquimaris]